MQLSVPVAASKLLQRRGTKTTSDYFVGRRVVISKDRHVIEQVLQKGAFSQRPATECGLYTLRMLNEGIVWNNNVTSAQKLRKAFQKSFVRPADIKHLTRSALGFVLEKNITASKVIECATFSRHITSSVIVALLLGDANNMHRFIGSQKHLELLDHIEKFFPAWAYTLYRPALAPLGVYANCGLSPVAGKWLLCKLDKTYKMHATRIEKFHDFVQHNFSDVVKQNEPEDRKHNLFENVGDITAHEFRQVVVESLFAGTDTSSVTISNTLHYLATHQDTQEDIFQEITRCSEDEDEFASVPKLYELWVRVSKLRPVGPVIMRTCNSDTVTISPALTFHRGDHFIAQLQDSWKEEEDEKVRRCSHALFGYGIKSCIGREIALPEVCVVLVSLLRDYEVKLHPDCQPFEDVEQDVKWKIAQKPEVTLHLILEKRVK